MVEIEHNCQGDILGWADKFREGTQDKFITSTWTKNWQSKTVAPANKNLCIKKKKGCHVT